MDPLSKKLSSPFSDDSSSADEDGGFSYKKFRPKKKRRSDAGRRYQRGLLYDSALGITCHFCRQKTTQKHVYCRVCVLALCGPCLRNRHGEDLEIETADDNWLCPKCRGGCGRGCKNCCNCTFCRKKLGLKPPKFAAGELRAHGFDNVHDYLIHLETGESADKIWARKAGKGWCSSYDKRQCRSQQELKPTKQKAREMRKDDLNEEAEGAASMCQEGINAEYNKKPIRKSDQSVNVFKSESLMQNRDTYQVRNGDEDKTSNVVSTDTHHVNKDDKNASGTTSGAKSQSSKVELFPRHFRPRNEFKEKLEAKLAQPFDADELKKLWNAITCRKPLCKSIETNQGTSVFPSKVLGSSYIHHHQDLAQAYTATGEPEVKLKLLRGFFFWLEHASMSGSFKPWKGNAIDDECLELNGPDCEVLGVLLNVDKEQKTPNTLRHEECQEDIKPDINKITESLSSQSESQSKMAFKWDEEDIKPKVKDLADWRSSFKVQTGRA